ncbi:polymer-forming cytoskeletal protein [Methylophilaceae bacterium]|jgi:cytoskeletal protein CcmA (bactofilin family)|nr:polymer-forming cytoskeletal protein [Methylophilaceae bacterium]|tara:strand:- start:930 stop:1355 length:426 start_codon:yes stop_codon:yes gene_type:complete
MLFKKKKKLGAIDTLIDIDIVIKGNTSYSGGLRLDGKIYGDLTVVEDSGGTLIMGEKSRIKGSVMVEIGIIAGEIIGDVKCYEYLELQPGSIIKGNIEYNSIEIHAGAIVNGELRQVSKTQKKLPFKKDKKVEVIGDKNDS